MPDRLKLTLQLTAHKDDLELRATTPLGGEGKAETALPPRDPLDQLTQHDPANIPPPALERAGRMLYQSLMVGDVAKLASGVLQEARRLKQPVQFEFRFDADQVSLAQYPWEIIVDDFGHLVPRSVADVTRYINHLQPPPSFDTLFDDLTLLRVLSSPPGRDGSRVDLASSIGEGLALCHP
jgi:hypothetical protein